MQKRGINFQNNNEINNRVSVCIIAKNEEAEIKESIKKVIDLPEISPLFEPNLEVITEKEILTPDGKMQRPDRVVIKNGTAFILDYKTGSPKEFHQTQIRNYAKLYREMGYENVDMMIVYLENSAVWVVD